jgi:hypothetical protein
LASFDEIRLAIPSTFANEDSNDTADGNANHIRNQCLGAPQPPCLPSSAERNQQKHSEADNFFHLFRFPKAARQALALNRRPGDRPTRLNNPREKGSRAMTQPRPGAEAPQIPTTGSGVRPGELLEQFADAWRQLAEDAIALARRQAAARPSEQRVIAAGDTWSRLHISSRPSAAERELVEAIAAWRAATASRKNSRTVAGAIAQGLMRRAKAPRD